ncbi:reverse transcriptase domain, reverse transcriptase zinc-binding domain protein [Tanacetum coccineum]
MCVREKNAAGNTRVRKKNYGEAERPRERVNVRTRHIGNRDQYNGKALGSNYSGGRRNSSASNTRRYNDVVRGKTNDGKEGSGGGEENKKEDVYRMLELSEEDVEMEVFSRSLIGEVKKKLSYLVKLPKLCDAVGLPKVKVKLLGGLEVMLVFETPGTADNIMKNVDHGLRRWVHKISMRIAEEHGYVMKMNNCSLVGNQNITIGRVCVHTVTKGLIKEYLKIKVKDIIFEVSVIEEIRDVILAPPLDMVEYQVQESTNQEKNEEDGHGLMNMEEDEINDGEKKRRNSESDGSGGNGNGSGLRSARQGSREPQGDEQSRVSSEFKINDTFEGEDVISQTEAAAGNTKTLGNIKACKSSGVVPRKRDENKVIGSSNGNVNFENDGPIVVEDGVIVMGQNVNNIDASKVDGQNIGGLYVGPISPNNIHDMGPNKEDNVMQSNSSNIELNQVIDVNIGDTIVVEDQMWEKRDDSPPNPNGSGGDRCHKKRKKSINGNFEGSNDIHFSHGTREGSNSNRKKSGRRSFNRAKNLARKIDSLYNGGDKDENKHVCSISDNEMKEVGEQIGVMWDEVAGKVGIGAKGKLRWVKSIIKDEQPSVIGLQETKSGIVDEYWVEEVWGNRCFGFTQLTSNENSGGIILIWDANMFVCKEAMGDERFIAVKEEVDIKAVVSEAWKKVVRGSRPDCWFRDKLKNVKGELKVWSKNRFGLMNEKIEEYRRIAMEWELQAEIINLNEGEMAARWCEEPNVIKQEMVRYYKILFTERAKIRSRFYCDRVVIICDEDADVRSQMVLGDYGDFERVVKKVIGEVVGDVQNAFIKGRFILDGFLIANETIHFLKKTKRKCLVFKVRNCLESASTSILVNGSPTEEFVLERGVRQGDPLSPFLFILMAKGLNALVSEAVEKGIFKGVAVGADRVIVSHLQYADDTIFFGEWSKENVKALICILKCFEEVSGLKVIYNKSKLYSISVSASDSEVMARWMSCSMGEFPFTYLWLPIGERMSCIEAWRPVVEKFINRLANWKARSMSFGGRLTLVKSVLGNGRDVSFWLDRWIMDSRLCDRFPRLFHLDRRPEGRVAEKGRDIWRWKLNEEGGFVVKELTRILEERILDVENVDEDTVWLKLVPKKVNIFMWRALKRRLSVREELDKRGVDLDMVLFP